MKAENKPIEYRSKTNLETYYHYPSWGTKEIDGEVFLSVSKFYPDKQHLREIYWVKKDNLEIVKK